MNIHKAEIFQNFFIEYTLAGPAGAPVVFFVHGLGSTLEQFEPQERAFSREWRVLAASLRGHGGSSRALTANREGYSLAELSIDLVRLLDWLQIEQVHWVGNSLGGILGLEVLQNHPARLQSLTTFGTTAELKAGWLHRNLQVTMIRLLSPDHLASLVARSASKEPGVGAKLAKLYRQADKDALLHITENIAVYDYTQIVSASRKPMLLIRASEDREINARLSSTLAAAQSNPGFTLQEIPGAGHFTNLDRPETFNLILSEFLKSLAPTRKNTRPAGTRLLVGATFLRPARKLK